MVRVRVRVKFRVGLGLKLLYREIVLRLTLFSPLILG